MTSAEALEHIKKGDIVVDKDYYGYKLIMGEIYKYRKSSGELLGIREFLDLEIDFSLPVDPPTIDLEERVR